MSLTGRHAVVTGGGRGIGRATAVALAEAGVSRVAVVARSTAQLEESAAAIARAGAEPVVVAADLTDLGALEAVAGELIATLGRVDVLVNNAGVVAPLGPTVDLAPADVQQAFRINAIAPVLLSARLAPGMIERGWGRIVAVSSGIVDNARNAVGSGVYAATKSALEAHALAFAAELRGTGVTVNAYRPGTVDTSMQQWVRDQDPARIGRDLHARFVASHEKGTLLTPEHSARTLVARLASEATGEVWDVAAP